MSLFDVIRYPVTWPPTVQLLEALPNKVLKQWALGLHTNPKHISIDSGTYLAYWIIFAKGEVGSKFYISKNDINELRKLLEEYDESL